MHVQNHAAPSLSQFNRSTEREDFDRRSSHVQHACKVDHAATISSTGHLFEDFDSLKPTSCTRAAATPLSFDQRTECKSKESDTSLAWTCKTSFDRHRISSPVDCHEGPLSWPMQSTKGKTRLRMGRDRWRLKFFKDSHALLELSSPLCCHRTRDSRSQRPRGIDFLLHPVKPSFFPPIFSSSPPLWWWQRTLSRRSSIAQASSPAM